MRVCDSVWYIKVSSEVGVEYWYVMFFEYAQSMVKFEEEWSVGFFRFDIRL